ncbi:MAG: type II secretion system F family protein, partial [Gemmataceae bacterium]|nr:type II secretion system F family protein [Gemmataceae bacterium]
MPLFGFLSADDLAPVFAFVGILAGTFWLLSALSARNSQAEERLARLGRPKSLAEIDLDAADEKKRFAGLKDVFSNLGGAMEPQSELEKNSLRIKLANAGFRSEQAAAVYQGLRVVCLVAFLLPALFFFILKDGFTLTSIQYTVLLGGVGFYLPQAALWQLRSARQKEIFLTLPDALDLLVVCVESGLGLDAALRKVTDEMKGHA